MGSDVNSTISQWLRVLVLCCGLMNPAAAGELRLLFMGDNGHHRPADRFHELWPYWRLVGYT